MSSSRLKILLGVAAVLLGLLVWNWISNWGLVTVHVLGQPLSKVIRSIERQGGIEIATNADPSTPVTLDVDKAPPAAAVDALAARLDGGWSVVYVAGPSKADVAAGVAEVKSGERNSDFRAFGFGRFGGFGGGMLDSGDTVIDPRRVSWKVSVADDGQLQSYLEQFSIKTGAGAMVPASWNPAVPKPPGGGKAASAIRSLVGRAHGQVKELFVLRVSDREEVADRGSGDRRGGNEQRAEGGFGGAGGGGPRREFHPEWMEERAMASIEQLPAAEREQAKKDFQDMRDFFQKIRSLPEDQRRAEMEKFFNNPAVQDRMMERMMTRDAKRSPEKRADRFRRYVERKQQMKSGNSTN
jgi:hypothetical protein